jgi:hypothetical protein
VLSRRDSIMGLLERKIANKRALSAIYEIYRSIMLFYW